MGVEGSSDSTLQYNHFEEDQFNKWMDSLRLHLQSGYHSKYWLEHPLSNSTSKHVFLKGFNLAIFGTILNDLFLLKI